MTKINDYFLDQRGNKFLNIKLENFNVKPITFCHLIYDSRFDSLKKDYSHEFLKMRVVCQSKTKILKELLKFYKYNFNHNFWVLKKRNIQLMGICVQEFFNLIKNKRGYVFNYPLICNNYNLIFNGISCKPETYNIFIYFNNAGFSYIDLIDNFRKTMKEINQDIFLEKIGRIKSFKNLPYEFENIIPKVILTLGFDLDENYCEFYYLIKNPFNKTNTLIDKISHLIIWNNETQIRYNEKRKFSIWHPEILSLDELDMITLRARNFDKFGDFKL